MGNMKKRVFSGADIFGSGGCFRDTVERRSKLGVKSKYESKVHIVVLCTRRFIVGQNASQLAEPYIPDKIDLETT